MTMMLFFPVLDSWIGRVLPTFKSRTSLTFNFIISVMRIPLLIEMVNNKRFLALSWMSFEIASMSLVLRMGSTAIYIAVFRDALLLKIIGPIGPIWSIKIRGIQFLVTISRRISNPASTFLRWSSSWANSRAFSMISSPFSGLPLWPVTSPRPT